MGRRRISTGHPEVAGPEVPGVPYNHVLEEWFMVNPEKIADGIRTLAAY